MSLVPHIESAGNDKKQVKIRNEDLQKQNQKKNVHFFNIFRS